MSILIVVIHITRFLSASEVSELLGVSKRTLARYRQSGELPFALILEQGYYCEADVRDFILKRARYFDK